MLTTELSKDNWLLLCMGVAKELGYSLRRLLEEVSEEELLLWSAYFGYLNDEQDKAMKKAKNKRR